VFVFFISPSDWTRLIRSQLSAAFVLGVTLHGDWSCSVEYGFVNGALPNLTVDHHFLMKVAIWIYLVFHQIGSAAGTRLLVHILKVASIFPFVLPGICILGVIFHYIYINIYYM
jgi:hypothetical protein